MLSPHDFIDKLYPICRSITGQGIRDSLDIIKDYIPLTIHEVKTGTDVFDWTIPKEWMLIHGYLKDSKGNVIIDAGANPLHVVNFSDSFSGEVSLEELKNGHLFSLETLPSAIPYVTSYYKDTWGFCLPYNDLKDLHDSTYFVDIETHKKDGALVYGRAYLEGKSKKKIILTSYLCHPNMLNNELSGPLTLALLYEKLANRKSRYYSYEFFLNPETIGALAIMATRKNEFTDNLEFGMTLTCMAAKRGQKPTLSFKLSYNDMMLRVAQKHNIIYDKQSFNIDRYLRELAQSRVGDIKLRGFNPTSGSDERQYCAPNVNLPFVQASVTPYGTYEEYHTSLDNKDLFSINSIVEATDKLFDVICDYELYTLKVKSTVIGEPQLGKRGLYPTLNTPLVHKDKKIRANLNQILYMLSLTCGSLTLFDIAKVLNMSLEDAKALFYLLEDNGLLTLVDSN